MDLQRCSRWEVRRLRKIGHFRLGGGSAPNGPGLTVYLVMDREQNRAYTFDAWGQASFLDIDGDGDEELVIEFPGLHMSPPDGGRDSLMIGCNPARAYGLGGIFVL